MQNNREIAYSAYFFPSACQAEYLDQIARFQWIYDKVFSKFMLLFPD